MLCTLIVVMVVVIFLHFLMVKSISPPLAPSAAVLR